jgi:3-dehydroquinate synthase
VVVAFGGGSVGDLAGFVAATFHRGIAWVAVPTTLLGQVDAAVGGKTAIDLPEAKNAVGRFHPPLAVVADPAPLATLDRAALRGGLVEALKTGAALDAALFEAIADDANGALSGDPGALERVAAGAARAKAGLVETDLEEAGPRALLNFGHTAGHAFEAAAGFGVLAHGDAVAHGIGVALDLSQEAGLPAADAGRLRAALARLAPPPLPALDPETVLRFLGRDKKARRGGVGWVLLERLGAGRYGVEVAPERVEAAVREALLRSASESL